MKDHRATVAAIKNQIFNLETDKLEKERKIIENKTKGLNSLKLEKEIEHIIHLISNLQHELNKLG